MGEHLGQCLQEAKNKIQWLMKIHRYSSLLEDYSPALAGFKELFLNYYRSTRCDTKANSDNMAENSEESDTVLEIMATARAYFQGMY